MSIENKPFEGYTTVIARNGVKWAVYTASRIAVGVCLAVGAPAPEPIILGKIGKA